MRLVALFFALASACARFDKQKFEPVRRAGTALQVELASSGGTTPQSTTLLRTFQTEVAMLDGRTAEGRERDVLAAYQEAADALMLFVRFRALDLESVNGRILVMGTNLDAAQRYKLSLIRIGDGEWVDAGDALKTFHDRGTAALARADRLVNGQN